MSFGGVAVLKDIIDELFKTLTPFFSKKNIYSLLIMAALRILYPKTPYSRMQQQYHQNFLSVFFPGVPLSKNHITDLLKAIGENTEPIKGYFQQRAEELNLNDLILIDGTLRKDTSKTNNLSHFSFKGKEKGVKNISVIYALDQNSSIPICNNVYAGNTLDCKAYNDFIINNNITKGIIVADKGFPIKAIGQHVYSNNDLHFISPLKRNSALIYSFDGYHKWQGFLKNQANNIQYSRFELNEQQIYKYLLDKKIKANNTDNSSKENTGASSKDNTGASSKEIRKFFLYMFKDCYKSQVEIDAFYTSSRKKKTFDIKKSDKKNETAGTIAFISDLDLPAEEIYNKYKYRWDIEEFFRKQKIFLGLKNTYVQGDYATLGTEFVNYLTSLMYSKLEEKLKATDLLEKKSFNEIIADLNQVRRTVKFTNNDIIATTTLYKDDQYLCVPFSSGLDILEKLGILIDAKKKVS